MTTLNQITEGLERTWDSIAEGWRQLRQRAGHALTRFSPGSARSGAQTGEAGFLQQASRWGLLAADVSESDEQVRVRLEVPGLNPEDIDLQVVDGNILVVRGEKQVQRERSDDRMFVMECAYGSFERAIPLPAEVEEGAAKASYRRGVLDVMLPRKPAARGRRIEVQH
jgi:HSP20 family protein